MSPTRCDRSAAWASLKGHFEAHGRDFDLREAFGRDAGRFDALGVQAPEVFADLSKNLLDTATLHFLLDLARECQLELRRDAMFAGASINVTEGRAVLHTALRAPRGRAPFSNEVHAVLDAMLSYVEMCATPLPAASATSSTSASAAATWARKWWCRRSTPSRTRG